MIQSRKDLGGSHGKHQYIKQVYYGNEGRKTERKERRERTRNAQGHRKPKDLRRKALSSSAGRGHLLGK